GPGRTDECTSARACAEEGWQPAWPRPAAPSHPAPSPEGRASDQEATFPQAWIRPLAWASPSPRRLLADSYSPPAQSTDPPHGRPLQFQQDTPASSRFGFVTI